MPSTVIHEIVAKQLSKELKTNKTLFVIGNILPDSWRACKNTSRKKSHIQNLDNNENYEYFYKKYKENIKKPIYLGYLTHLMTDYYWKNYVYKKYMEDNSEYTKEYVMKIRKQIKKSDWELIKKYKIKKIKLKEPVKVNIEELSTYEINETNDAILYANNIQTTTKEKSKINIESLETDINKTCSFIQEELQRLSKE